MCVFRADLRTHRPKNQLLLRASSAQQHLTCPPPFAFLLVSLACRFFRFLPLATHGFVCTAFTRIFKTSAKSIVKQRMSGTLIGQELEPALLVDVELHSPRDPELHPSQHAHQQQLGGKMEYNYLQARFAEPGLNFVSRQEAAKITIPIPIPAHVQSARPCARMWWRWVPTCGGGECAQRVKVYRLNDDGKWDDKGTGHVSVEYLERSDAIGLVVIDEEDNATLLVHRISTDDIYQRQEDTIISWTDPEVATDLALSFQESMGCAYIWDQICNVQRQIQLPSVLATEVAKESSELPAVETRTLPAIAKLVTDVSPFHRDRMASLILREGYVARLVALFRASEGAHDTPALHLLYRVFKGLVLLNDSQLLEQLFAPDAIMDVIGALEYDPDVPCRQQHRSSVQQQAVYREALPIPNATLLAKIHQTYRLGYIKVRGMVACRQAEEGLHAQLLEMLRVLLDPHTMDAADKSKFLDLFYEDYLQLLISAVVAGTNASQPYYVLRNSVAEKVLRLTQRREKYLSVAAIRFLRCCVALKDDFYVRYLVKNRLLDPVMAAFRANGARYNLLNSAVLELIDFVRKRVSQEAAAWVHGLKCSAGGNRCGWERGEWSPKGGSPKGRKGGSPKSGSPKGGSPKGGSPKGGSPKGDLKVGCVRSVGEAGKKVLSMRKRFLQVRTQDNTTDSPLGEVVPGGGAPKERGGAMGREEATLGVCSPRPVLCDPWRSARGEGREGAGSAEGDEGDGGDEGEWAVRLAMAEEEEERRQADGGDGDGIKGGGKMQRKEKADVENAGSGAMSLADEAGGADGVEARTAAPGGAQGAARSVVEALR
ncbi:unnamed protein product [Closterium sp. Yama58-4]|nr:unnamed protein product [Closterium sp. Yama58-4]